MWGTSVVLSTQTKMFKLVVLFSVLALAAAKPGWLTPVAYSTVPAVSSVSQYSSGVYHGTPAVVPSVYRAYSPVVPSYGVVPVATVAQAPHSPAVVLDPVHGVPLDTPEVVAARAAHYQAKALAGAGVHTIAKRSVVVSPVTSYAAVSPVVSPYSYTPYVSAYGAPSYTYPTVYPRALSVHPW